MDYLIEDILTRIAPAGSPAAIVRALDPSARGGDSKWSGRAPGDLFSTFEANVGSSGRLKITFFTTPRGGTLGAITADPGAWEVGATQSDRGRRGISRDLDLPGTGLAARCITVVKPQEPLAATPITDVTCFLSEP